MDFKENIKDFILLMLGAPVVKIELDKQQLDLIIEQSINLFEMYTNIPFNSENKKMINFIQSEIALPHAKIVLGYIRRKYNSIGGNVKTDGYSLVKEGHKALNYFREEIGPNIRAAQLMETITEKDRKNK